jgi:hypothetical protein
MALRMQKERQDELYLPSMTEYVKEFCDTSARLKKARPKALVMHPGPTNRGVVIAADVADGADGSGADGSDGWVLLELLPPLLFLNEHAGPVAVRARL